VTRSLMTNEETVAPSSPRSVHIVDATLGPLIGNGRLRRVFPFAATATISIIVAVPETSWIRPGFAVAAAVLIAVAITGAVVFPWKRVGRSAQVTPPLLFLVATLLFAYATGNIVGSPFVTLAVLPLMWLAIYENRNAVLFAAMLAGVGLWLASSRGNVQPAVQGNVTTVVFLVCAVGMGITLHGLVADARKLAHALRDHQVALVDAAAMLNSLTERVSRYRLPDHVLTYCNVAWAAQYQVDPAQALGRPMEDFLSADELVGLNSQLAVLGTECPTLIDSVPRAVPNAPDQWLQWVDRYLAGTDGTAEVLSIGRDVTERHQVEIKLAESEARFRDLAEKSADVVWRFVLEPTPHFDYMSPSVERILGYPPSYFLGEFDRMLSILDEASSTAVVRAIRGERVLERFDFHFRHANGSIVIGETRTTLIPGGLQGVSRDVTELRQLQAETAALALRDPLTGLANRRLFQELLDAARARTERSGQPLAVAFLDLDGFKNVNDTHGHDAGDVVLSETARRLSAVVRGADTIARLGGDEFAIVYEPNEANSQNFIARLDRALSVPINLTPTTAVRCRASIGIAETGTVGYDSAALLAAADLAMYVEKRVRKKVRDAPPTGRPDGTPKVGTSEHARSL
jgi:diguanylate cyclase (GGDEF)-like protein/PAS domain S-box-containing protein